MIIVPHRSAIQNVIFMSACLIPKMSKNGGSECRSIVGVECHLPKQESVGLSPITRFDVEERPLDAFVWEFVRHLSCPPPTVICRIKSEVPQNGITRE